MLKQFPHLLGALHPDDLTEEQLLWLRCQLLLDQGVLPCPACEALDIGAFCRACGAAKVDTGTVETACPRCQATGPGPYCIHCGESLGLMEQSQEPTTRQAATAQQITAGTFDWAAWERQMAAMAAQLGGAHEADR
jgi:hypothetical protein